MMHTTQDKEKRNGNNRAKRRWHLRCAGAANDAQIESLARFAVDEYNKKENGNLVFVRVISAKKQDVAGTNYYITLEAKDGESIKEYEAKVWVREWLNSKELLQFNPSNSTIAAHPTQVRDVASLSIASYME